MHRRDFLIAATAATTQLTTASAEQTPEISPEKRLLVLQGKPRPDQEFPDWIKKRPYLVIDMRDVFRAEFQKSRQTPGEFLKPYYNGHHSPAGNFYTAWAIKDQVANWLEPAPLPYR